MANLRRTLVLLALFLARPSVGSDAIGRAPILEAPTSLEGRFPVLTLSNDAVQLIVEHHLPLRLPRGKEMPPGIEFVMTSARVCAGSAGEMRVIGLIEVREENVNGAQSGVAGVAAVAEALASPLPAKTCDLNWPQIAGSLPSPAGTSSPKMFAEIRGRPDRSTIGFRVEKVAPASGYASSGALADLIELVFKTQALPVVDLDVLTFPVSVRGTQVTLTLAGYPVVVTDRVAVVLARPEDRKDAEKALPTFIPPVIAKTASTTNGEVTVPVTFVEQTFTMVRARAGGPICVLEGENGAKVVFLDTLTLASELSASPSLIATGTFKMHRQDGTWNSIGLQAKVRATSQSSGLFYPSAPAAVKLTGITAGNCASAPIPKLCEGMNALMVKMVAVLENALTDKIRTVLGGRSVISAHVQPLSIPLSTGAVARPTAFSATQVHLDRPTASTLVVLLDVE